MTWRAVKLLTRDNLLIVVPNAELAAAQIINYDLPTPAWRQRLQLTLPLDTDPARVHRLLAAVVQEVAECAALPHLPEARIESIGAAVAHWELRFWVPDYASSSRVTQRVQEALLRHLRGAGLHPATEREEVLLGSLLRQQTRWLDRPQGWLDGVTLFDPLLTGAPRSATLRTATAAVLQEIRRDDLAPLLRENPALAERFAEVLADRRLADERRAGLRTGTADPQERQSSIAALLRRARQWFALAEAAPQGD